MKRLLKIFLCLLLVLLIAAAMLFWRYRGSLKAVRDGLHYSSEELQQKIDENKQRVQDTVNDNPELQVRELTDEEKAALKDGSISKEEIISMLIEPQPTAQTQTEEPPAPAEAEPGPASAPEPAPQEQPQEKPLSEEEKAALAYQQALSALVAETLVLQAEYTDALDEMEAEAKAAYRELPKEERTSKKLMEIASRYAAKAYNFESECDDKFFGVTERMEALIRENNGNMEIVDTVIDAYLSEKSLKQAYYISELEKRGLS